MGVIRGTYLAMEHMSKLSGGRGGVIINTASMAGKAHVLSAELLTESVGFSFKTQNTCGPLPPPSLCPGLSPLLSCPVYTATKNGVVGFTRAMAVSLTVYYCLHI